RLVAARDPPLHRLGGSDARMAFRGAALRQLRGAPAARGADRPLGDAMRRRAGTLALAAALAAAALACRTGGPPQGAAAGAGQGAAAGPGPDDAQLDAADSDRGEWLIYGRTYAEQRYSPLSRIDETNVSRLGLAWTYETGTTRGLE